MFDILCGLVLTFFLLRMAERLPERALARVSVRTGKK
jgi:hypothetical protein